MALRAPIFGLLVLPFGFAAAWHLQQGIDRQLAAVHQERDDLLLRSGKFVNMLSLEYGSFLADVYWTRAVQYFGDKHVRQDTNLELLPSLLDLATTLDPHLVIAYRVGSMFLAEPAPRGAGRPDLAVALLRRGIQENPGEWRMWQDLGFIYYWELHDYTDAAQAFFEGSKQPGAAEWMKALAAKIAGEGRSRAISAFLWADILRTTTNPMIRKNAERQLKILRAEEDCDRLNEVIAAFTARFKRPPRALDELVASGLLPAVPVDPEGYPYVLGPDGKAAIHPKSPLNGDARPPAP